jgi:septum formation protein
LLITCDQIVLFEGKVREKPENEEEAKYFLQSYEFGPATCVNGVVITNTKTRKSVRGYNLASIYFKKIPEDVIDSIIKNGDAMNCSGSFFCF